MHLLVAILEAWLATLFVFTGCHKALARRDAEQAVINYRLIPESIAGTASIFLACWEILTGLALVAGGVATTAAGVSAVVLGVLFAAVAASARMRGIDIRCGCTNAALSQRVGLMTVFRALLIIGSGGLISLASSGGLTPWLAVPALGLAAMPATTDFVSSRLQSHRRNQRLERDIDSVVKTLESLA